jgi:hypothetical protein
MNKNWQYFVVGALFIAAIVYIVKTFTKSSKGESCASGACKCEPNHAAKHD